MKHLLAACLISTAVLSGCAATVERGGLGTLVIPEPAKQNVTVAFKGNSKVEANSDWSLLQRTWAESLKAEGAEKGYRITQTDPETTPPKQDGVLVLVSVSNFRFLTTGARYGAGSMTGNAWVNSSADFVDLTTGRKVGTRTYDTTSTAWEGVMSAMTEKQVRAISKQIIEDIKSAKPK